MNLVKYQFLNDIGTCEVLDNSDLNLLFTKTRHHVQACVLEVADVCQWIQHHVLNLAAAILGGVVSGKSVFKKTAVLEGDDHANKSHQANEHELGCHAMDLAAAMLRQDAQAQKSILVNNNLSKAVFENCLKNWLDNLPNYEQSVGYTAKLYSQDDLLHYSQCESQLQAISHNIAATQANYIFGVYRFVKTRLEANHQIYARIFEAYVRLLLPLSKATAGSNAQENDSIQNGSFGLMHAINMFDHCGNFSFPNYAKVWIKQSILFALKEEANTIKIPSSNWQIHSDLERKLVRLEAKHGPLSLAELAEKLGCTQGYVENIYRSIKATQVKSIDSLQNCGDAKSEKLFNMLTNLVDESHANQVEKHHNAAKISQALATLSTNERMVMCLYFGLFDLLPNKSTPAQVSLSLASEKQRQLPTKH